MSLTASNFLQAAGTGGRAPAMGWSQTFPSPPQPYLTQQRCRWAPRDTAVWAGAAAWGTAATAHLWTILTAPVRLGPAAASACQTQVSMNVHVSRGQEKFWCFAAGQGRC